jgi:hypothetical protein
MHSVFVVTTMNLFGLNFFSYHTAASVVASKVSDKTKIDQS